MTDAPDTVTRAEVVEIAAEAVQAVARELRAEFALATTPPAPAEDEGSATSGMALAAHALVGGTGSAAEFTLALRNVFGPHAAVVLDAARRLGPRSTTVKEATL